ncbi:hypothetical protein ACFVZL_36235 [Streptomyces sp. NPDC058320]|uniref:hypothetical protein n=1 Tax=unclassified Streptomyces TaxID=2593676 RepID=UPI00363B9212
MSGVARPGGLPPRPVGHRVEVDRVVVLGTQVADLSTEELRELVAAAVTREVRRTRLPAGRTVRASVRLPARPVDGGGRAVADAIGSGVAQALGGGHGRE